MIGRILLCFLFLLPPPAFAAVNDFDYPELNVTPRASDRLVLEAQKENQNQWRTHLPLQVSAMVTLTAGILQLATPNIKTDPKKQSGLAGLAVGGGWLVLTTAMAMYYNPYSSAAGHLNVMGKKSTRDLLVRERYAEEEINSTSSLAKKLMWLSVATNFGTAIYMAGKSEPETLSSLVDGIAIATAFAPLVFRSRWMAVSNEQQEYKKRIYAPVATVIPEPGTGNPAPGLILSVFF
ncbi:MAG: hypothetical protein AABZ06_01375 [Bdellovibrionota bacterium]